MFRLRSLISRFSSFVAVALILLASAPALAQEPDLSEVQTSGMETFFRWFRAAFDPLLPIVLVGVGLLAGGLFVWIVARAFIRTIKRLRGGADEDEDDDTLSTWDEEMGGGAAQTSVQPTQREQDRSSSPAAPAAPQVTRRQRKKEKEAEGWSLFEQEKRGRKRSKEDRPIFDFGMSESRGRRAPKEPAPVFGAGGFFGGESRSSRRGSGGIDISPAGGFSLLGGDRAPRRKRRGH